MTKQITLTQGKVALVDDDMYEFLNQWKWSVLENKKYGTFYAQRHDVKTNKTILMHRVVRQAKDGSLVDHKNINGTLDNRRENLRICISTNNMCNRRMFKNNRSGFKGVYWEESKEKFRAYIAFKKEKIHIGYFDTPEEAARAYDAKARELHGEFANTNFGA